MSEQLFVLVFAECGKIWADLPSMGSCFSLYPSLCTGILTVIIAGLITASRNSDQGVRSANSNTAFLLSSFGSSLDVPQCDKDEVDARFVPPQFFDSICGCHVLF